MKLEEIIYGRVIDTQEEFKNNKSNLIIFLRSSCGNLKFKMWDYDPDDSKFPKRNSILKIKLENLPSAQEEYSKFKSVVLRDKNFIYIDKVEVPEQYHLTFFPEPSKEDLEKALGDLIDKNYWDDKKNHNFVLGCIKFASLDLFKECPAATGKHHAYKGGLLIHTHEVFGNCKAVFEANKNKEFIKKDVLFASAWLHDLGKTVTYFIDKEKNDLPSCTNQESRVTHSAYSCSIVYAYALQSNFANKEFLDEVLHCIASHHGRRDWSAIVEPQTIEAHILHGADNASSKLISHQ